MRPCQATTLPVHAVRAYEENSGGILFRYHREGHSFSMIFRRDAVPVRFAGSCDATLSHRPQTAGKQRA